MPLIDPRPYTLDRIARLIIGLLVLICAFYLLRFLSGVLVPFAIAFLLAYLLNPLVDFIQKYTHHRAWAVALSLLLVLVGCSLALLVLIPLLIREAQAIKPLLTTIAEMPPPAWLTRIAPYVQWDYLLDQFSNNEFLRSLNPENMLAISQKTLQRILPGMWNLISGTFNVIIGLFGLSIIVLYTIFLLFDYERIQHNWTHYLPPTNRQAILNFVHEFNDAMRRYFRGQTLVALIVGILFSFGFWLIGLPMGIVLGLFLGLLNIIPYMQIVGMIPVLLLSVVASLALHGNLWFLPLLTLIVMGMVQSIQDIFLVPAIIGKSSGMSPALILLSLAIWGRLFGIFGLLIAIPMTCLAIAYYQRLIEPAPTPVGTNLQATSPQECSGQTDQTSQESQSNCQ